MSVEMAVEQVTPKTAAAYLKMNVDNYRKISRNKVLLYAQEMKAGKWQLNGESIVFDRDGKLKNGQHRLAAVVAAGVPVEMTVIRGVENGICIYDIGTVRSLTQIANASGAPEMSTTECAVANLIVGNWTRISKSMSVDYVVKHGGELKRAARLCGANSKNSLGRRSSCVLAAYLKARGQMKNYEIELFFQVFNSGNVIGTDGYEPSPALVARRMFEERYRGRSNDIRSIREQTDILLMAMEDFAKGRKRQLNYKVQEPMICIAAVEQVRKEDGLA